MSGARSPAWGLPEVLSSVHVLDAAFFARDTRIVARELLGTTLLSRVNGVLCGGRIVETEAYLASDDPGSHACTKGMTKRNATMYGPPGSVYVYLSYGMHHMLNLVAEPEGVAGAVLIRAFEPVFGLETMRLRRNGAADTMLANGPGKAAAALGVTITLNGTALGTGMLAVLDTPRDVLVAVTGRVGLSSGHELPLRFHVENDPWVSRGRTGPVRRATGRV